MLAPLYKKPACHYCKHQLNRRTIDAIPPTNDFKSLADKSIFSHKASVTTDFFTCAQCGWWVVHQDFISGTDLADGVHWAKLKQFDIRKADVPIQHLRDYISKNPYKIYDISPQSFEKLLVDCLRDFFDCEARHVGGPGDGGIDIILVISDEPILVQVKRRSSPQAVESVRIVREILGTLLSENVYQGIIISTANRFSKEAIRNVELPVIKSKGYKVSLYDYQTVLKIITSDRKTAFTPWSALWPSGSDIKG
jgi:hypothetical protein